MPSFASLCSDFYVNQKISLRMDLPPHRETVPELFERVRRDHPLLERFRRYDGEVALESQEVEGRYEWVGMRQRALASGVVNPLNVEDAYRLHRLLLDLAPYYLSVAPLDVEYVELVYGFDLMARENRNEVVLRSLLGDSPLAALLEREGEPLLDVQPRVGFALNEACDLQAFVEVKTRTTASETATQVFQDDPISVFVTVRRNGPLRSVEDFTGTFGTLAGHLEQLAEQRVIPDVVVPLHQAIAIG